MLDRRKPRHYRRDNDEEKPFWISFADLMTALMVLFLVAMAVALLGMTQGLRKIDESKVARDNGISSCLSDIRQITQLPAFSNVKLQGQLLEMGPLAEFRKDSNELNTQSADRLRQFVAPVLEVARTPSCQNWLKRFVLEGYASPEGSYLYNLNLSLERSQRVLCVLLDPSAPDALSQEDRRDVRALFFVGGSSFNSAILNQPAKSRRVELRLEFKELKGQCTPSTPACEVDEISPLPWDDDFRCPVNAR